MIGLSGVIKRGDKFEVRVRTTNIKPKRKGMGASVTIQFYGEENAHHMHALLKIVNDIIVEEEAG